MEPVLVTVADGAENAVLFSEVFAAMILLNAELRLACIATALLAVKKLSGCLSTTPFVPVNVLVLLYQLPSGNVPVPLALE